MRVGRGFKSLWRSFTVVVLILATISTSCSSADKPNAPAPTGTSTSVAAEVAQPESSPATSAPAQANQSGLPTTTSGAADDVVVRLRVGEPLDIRIESDAGLLAISGDADAFSSDGEMRLALVSPSVPQEVAAAFIPAGPGISVEFANTQLVEPLRISIPANRPTGVDWVPASLHVTDSGDWDFVPASYIDGEIVVETAEFSGHLPGWVSVSYFRDLLGELFDNASDFVSGRTDPGPCPPSGYKAAPEWATLLGPISSAMHACLATRFEGPTGRDIVAVDLKSNRGTYVVLSHPGAMVLNQDLRIKIATYAGRAIGWLSSSESAIPPGASLTIGYYRGADSTRPFARIYADNYTLALSVISALFSKIPGGTFAEWYALSECVVDVPNLQINVGSIAGITKCSLTGLGELRKPEKAAAAARDLFGDARHADDLARAANRLKGFGVVLAFIGVLTDAVRIYTAVGDELAELFVDGAGTMEIIVEGYGWPTTLPPTTLPPTTLPPTTLPPTTPPPTGDLSVSLWENPFVCDGGLRQFGTVSGAKPGETIRFTSPELGTLDPGTANSSGTLTIRWVCDPSDAGATWQVTAKGETSGRTATFTVTGEAPAPPPTTPPPTESLSVSLWENPFACDGMVRQFGSVTGAKPSERIEFTSPDVSGLLSGTASASGDLTIQWVCDPPDAGDQWRVTATGQSSGRAVSFTVTGKVAAWVLPAGTTLDPGDRITSRDGRYYTVFQGDGNLVTYTSGGTPAWATGTDGTGGVRARMQTDGNLVIYTSASKPVWASGTVGYPGAYVRLDNAGYLRIVSSSGRELRKYRW